jgi:hypothetical protein
MKYNVGDFGLGEVEFYAPSGNSSAVTIPIMFTGNCWVRTDVIPYKRVSGIISVKTCESHLMGLTSKSWDKTSYLVGVSDGIRKVLGGR